jgi:hypothetical protein
MTEPTLLSLIRQVRAQRHATDALENERLRLEGSLIEFVEEAWPYVDAAEYQPNWATPSSSHRALKLLMCISTAWAICKAP